MWKAEICTQKFRAASSSSVHKPSIAVCFLISNRFETLPLWLRWMKSVDVKYVKGFLHYSNTSPEEEQEIISFSNETNSDLVESIQTEWGTSSLLKAEVILYDAAAQIDSITHFWLVSEKTAPIVSVPYLIKYTKDILMSKTQIAPIDDLKQYEYELYNIISKKIDVKKLKFANQFKYIHAVHWKQIRKDVFEMISLIDDNLHWSKENENMMHPDEFVIPTFLYYNGCEMETTEKTTWDCFENNDKRAKRLNLEEVKMLVETSSMKRKAHVDSEKKSRRKSVPKKREEIEALELTTKLLEYVRKARVLSVRKILREDKDILEYLYEIYI